LNLFQLSIVVEAGSSDFVDMILKRQFAVQRDYEIAYSVDALNNIVRSALRAVSVNTNSDVTFGIIYVHSPFHITPTKM